MHAHILQLFKYWYFNWNSNSDLPLEISACMNVTQSCVELLWPNFRMWDLGLLGVILRDSSPYLSKNTTENFKREGQQARPQIKICTSPLPVLLSINFQLNFYVLFVSGCSHLISTNKHVVSQIKLRSWKKIRGITVANKWHIPGNEFKVWNKKIFVWEGRGHRFSQPLVLIIYLHELDM